MNNKGFTFIELIIVIAIIGILSAVILGVTDSFRKAAKQTRIDVPNLSRP